MLRRSHNPEPHYFSSQECDNRFESSLSRWAPDSSSWFTLCTRCFQRNWQINDCAWLNVTIRRARVVTGSYSRLTVRSWPELLTGSPMPWRIIVFVNYSTSNGLIKMRLVPFDVHWNVISKLNGCDEPYTVAILVSVGERCRRFTQCINCLTSFTLH